MVKNVRRSYARKIEEQSNLCEGVLFMVHGLRPADEWINSLIRRYNLQLPYLNEEVCKNIIINCVVQAFADSNIAKSFNYGFGDYPLTDIATNVVNK